MEPLSAGLLSTLANAILGHVGKELGGAVTGGLKRRVLPNPERRALESALKRAFDTTRAAHGHVLAEYDINPGFLAHEGAAELAKVLVPGAKASASTLAERCVDSFGPLQEEDARWEHIVAVRPVFRTLLDSLRTEAHREPSLAGVLGRVDEAATADRAGRLVERFGAAAATADDEARYLHWIIDKHRYLRTAGVVRNTTVQLPLREVFVGLSAQRDTHPGDRSDEWFRREQAKLLARRESGQLDQPAYEAAVDRLRLQHGYGPADRPGRAPDEKELPVLEAVRDTAHLLVLGEPGCGKTTLLRYLALCNAQALCDARALAAPGTGHRRSPSRPQRSVPPLPPLPLPPLFPIYLRVGDYARWPHRNSGIGAFLPDYFRGQECRTPGLADLLERRLQGGGCLVLLDGLDEITSADDRRMVVDAVVSFVTANSRRGNRFVVTSRIAGYLAAPLPAPFGAIRVRDMDEPTIERFLDVYGRAVERAEAPEKSDEAVRADADRAAGAMRAALRSSAGVRRLAANPLLLTALVLVHRARGRLPHRRVDAYVEVAEALGRTWRNVQGVPEAELPDDRMLTTWLTRLGSWLHQHRPEGSATMRELLEVLGPLWARLNGSPWDPGILAAADPLDSAAGRGVRDFVHKADVHTGLLVERAPGRYGFPHLTFEEYYAGRALAFEGLASDRPAGIRSRLHDPRYAEPILLALGLVGREQPEEVERLVADAVYPAGGRPSRCEELLGRDFLFALRVLADDIPLDTATVDGLLRRAVDEWLHPDGGRCRYLSYRRALAERLWALGATRAAGRLMVIVDALAGGASATAPGPFCELAAVLARVGPLPERVASALTRLALDSTDESTRVGAVEALSQGSALTPEVIEAAVELAGTTRDAGVRIGAVLALGNSEAPGAIAVLARLSNPPAGSNTWLVAVDALTHNGSPTAIVTLAGLARAADRRDVREYALDSLCRSPAPGAVTAGVELARTADTDTRQRAILALTRHGTPAPEILTAATELAGTAGDAEVRVRAMQALAGAGALTPELITAAAELARADRDRMVRLGATAVLARAGALTPELIGAATDLACRSDDFDQGAEAVWAIAEGRRWTPEIVAALLAIARTATEPGVRLEAVRSFDGADALAPDTVTAIAEWARNTDDGYERVEALGVLSRAAGALTPEAATVVAELARDARHPLARVSAIEALAPPTDLPAELIAAVSELARTSNRPEVSLQAAALLSRVRPLEPPVVSALLGVATGADNWRARRGALVVLAETEPTAGLRAAILPLLRDSDNDVRKAAGRTLVEFARRHPEVADQVWDDLARACRDDGFDARDEYEDRPGWDYAYDALRTLSGVLATKA